MFYSTRQSLLWNQIRKIAKSIANSSQTNEILYKMWENFSNTKNEDWILQHFCYIKKALRTSTIMPLSAEEIDSILSEEPRPIFRPFTRESLQAIKTRIAEDRLKKKELEQKRADGEVNETSFLISLLFRLIMEKIQKWQIWQKLYVHLKVGQLFFISLILLHTKINKRNKTSLCTI